MFSLRFKKSAIAAAIIAPIAMFACAAGAADAPAPLKAGSYTVSTPGNNGMVEVTVELTDKAIKSIKIGKNMETEYIAKEPMESVAAEIIRGQNLAVDTVSGATQATGAILTAVGLAIEKAGGNAADFTHPYVPVDPAKLPLADAPSTQVLVIGAGATGLAAAASAAENGAKVIVLEKMPEIGGSTALSKGVLLAAGTKEQASAGIKDDASRFAKDWIAEQKRSVPGGNKAYPEKARIEAMTKASAETLAWLESKTGLKFEKPVSTDLTGTARTHRNAKGGKGEVEALAKFCESKGVALRTGTTAYELMRAKDGRITGVRAHDGKHRYEFKADAVVLATGGFAHSREMMEKLVPVYAPFVDQSVASVGDTGDGIRMAVEAGGVMYDDAWVIGLYVSSLDPKLSKTYTSKDKYKDRVFVNEKGERFVNEDLPYLTDPVAMQKSAWAIVDSSNAANAKLLDECKDPKIAAKGATWRELAQAIGVSPDALERTMTEYNEACETGVDKTFGKPATFLKPFLKAPFYAVRVIPQTGGTMGGVKVNDKFEVIRADGSPIQGLYAGGEVINRPYYNRVYTSGTGLGIAYTSGRIAGENAAKAALGKD